MSWCDTRFCEQFRTSRYDFWRSYGIRYAELAHQQEDALSVSSRLSQVSLS